MSFDAKKNFAITTVVTAPIPASNGTTVTVDDGSVFPAVPFNVTIWPADTQPTRSNAEICRVTAISTNTLTITRIQESSSARSIVSGDQIAETITAKSLTDIESVVTVLTTPDKESAPTITAGTLVLDYSISNVFAVALNANITTLTLSNWPATGVVGAMVIIFTADGTARTISWPAAVKWPFAVAPTPTSTNTKVDIYTLITYNGGTTIYGLITGQNF